MRIDEERCSGCFECIDYCPVGAIKEIVDAGRASIDEEECVECGCCLQVGVCEFEAIWQPELQWPRIIRAQFSNPRVPHPTVQRTSIYGRGTDEIKTNDVIGTYPRGYIAIAAELGRPGIGTCMEDIEKVVQAMLPLGVEFEKDNPTYSLFQDFTQAKLREDVRGERVLSAILECKTTEAKAPHVLKALHRIAREVNTVITVNVASMVEPDGSLPAQRIARKAGFEIRPNGKTNLGLGRPSSEISVRGKQ